MYVETSIVSCLTSRPNRDVVLAAHRQLTRHWWRGRIAYSVVTSQLVLDNAGVGDPIERARRLRALRGIPILLLTEPATLLAGELIRQGVLPQKATVDVFHIGIAAPHHVEYLLT